MISKRLTVKCTSCGEVQVVPDTPLTRGYLRRFGGAPCACGGRKVEAAANVTGRVVQTGPGTRNPEGPR